MDSNKASKIQKSSKSDLFEHPDFYMMDDMLTEEHKMVRSAVRDFVKREISPYI
ncbi:MAG: acyl-CoA dehydrogenase, partial [Roseivirga sp.]|nr:acyl-CoA dehydrogenase [Roseivirga sp.]